MERRIRPCQEGMTLLDVPDVADPIPWLKELAGGRKCWLLAHADDGVIWGRLEDGMLTTARQAAETSEYADEVNRITPPLRAVTLQTARLFNEDIEIFLWLDTNTGRWQARAIGSIVTADHAEFLEAIDESYLLWGSPAQPIGESFTLMEDGAQGLRHVLPVATSKRQRLRVRQLITEDETGFKRISANRLVAIEA